MKERPILFSAPMVRALLAGTKTQTRRVVKVQPHASHNPQHAETRGAGWVWMAHDDRPTYSFATGDFRCPYGQPGDRLWVREAWRRDIDKVDGSRLVQYRADDAIVEAPRAAFDLPSPGWVPSIHMPRWASRITLEVTGVRVERLHDITRGDAMSEGCPFQNMAGMPDPREWFADVWRKIHGDMQNRWLWVVEFKRC